MKSVENNAKMTDASKLKKMYVEKDTLSVRVGLHDKYSVNKLGWHNWLFNQYEFHDGIKILELASGTAEIWRGRDGGLPVDSEIILSDFSTLMVDKAKNLLSGNSAYTFEQIDIQNIPYDDTTFDIVIANHMLYHVPDQDKALSEVARVLKVNGRFYASTVGRNSLKELGAIYRKLEGKASFSYSENISFTLENGSALLSKYFTNIEKREYVDSLRVTDIDDLMAYITSYNDIPDSVYDDLYTLVKDGFSPEGIFDISKEQGLFICAK